MFTMFWGAPPKASYGSHSFANRIFLLFHKSPPRKPSMLTFLSRKLLLKSLGGLCTLGAIFFIAKGIMSLLHKASCGPEPSEQLSPQPLPHYIDLRKRANEEGDAMAKCFQESHEAYARGDGAGAKELSNEGKEHKQKMEQLNKQASDQIYVENNKNSKPGEINLHGLYVKEAIERSDIAIEDAKRRGDTEMHLIVGKGLHSSDGIAKIKPAIEALMQKHQLIAELDPNNAGVLIVQLVGPDEIARRSNRDEGCIVMMLVSAVSLFFTYCT
ncbi:hypothetical protein DFJ43DRAFT_221148 [Lentinula guzmanii]|uniref:Smr domain-containing protein n=1 Tax=Lentinula guzmanii TaxID=2804957 RepID=A0AA38N2T5_9AGAR|nr:hypothetical protein DFJ43DRAFT_221148 [Lentinula guzmanii]